MADVVAEDLRRRIVSGELGEGDALPREADLVEQYGVSRPTLREAIRILSSESLIRVRRGSRAGALVQPPDVRVAALHAAVRLQLDHTPLSDVFEARIELGAVAARRLAEQARPDAVQRLRELHAAEREASKDSVTYPVAVSNFHAAVVELAGNRSLALMRAILEEIVLAHERRESPVEPKWIAATQPHDLRAHGQLLQHITAGRAARAEALWRAHLTSSAAQVLAHLGPETVVDIVGRDGRRP
jgi:DNA-binding FadR family transcriptional regulator